MCKYVSKLTIKKLYARVNYLRMHIEKIITQKYTKKYTSFLLIQHWITKEEIKKKLSQPVLMLANIHLIAYSILSILVLAFR